MSNSPRPSPALPAQQHSIHTRCFHPNGGFVEFKREDTERSIPERFEQQVHKHADRQAIKTQRHIWTYEALNQAANRVGHAIRDRLGDGEEPIAILLEKGAPAIATLLGALKAGKVYVPLDLTFPREQLISRLDDAQAKLIVTDNQQLALAQALIGADIGLLNLDTLDAGMPAQNLGLPLSPDRLAYILYTSGSTGQPKGVVQNHRNVLHQSMWYINSLHISPDDRVTLFASLSTAQARSDMFSALLSGATLCPFDIREAGLAYLSQWLVREGITIYRSSASIFRSFIDALTGQEAFPNIRLVKLGSEPASKHDVELYKRYFPADCIFVNTLSSTETGVLRQYLIDKDTLISDNIVPVGYAVEGKEILLLDEAGAEVDIGEVGEIAVRSHYLTPGYWRQPELTRAAFQADPSGGPQRLYRTGDLGRFDPDGCLNHLGRKDFQVKVRGHRIQTAEIESMLGTHPAIRQAVVITNTDGRGDTRLVAYVVPADQGAPSIGTLRHFLQERLPDYMIPSAFVSLAALPLAPSGKVDRRRLPPPDWRHLRGDTPFVAPRTPIEEKLAQVWAEVLGLAQVGIHDHFLELGGHSLLAAQVISRVIETFQVDVPVRVLLEASTLAEMAMLIAEQQMAEIAHVDLEHLVVEVEGMAENEVKRRLGGIEQ